MANEHDGDLDFHPFGGGPRADPDHNGGLDFYPFGPSDLPPPGHVRGPGPARRSTSRGRAKAGPLGPCALDVDVAENDNRRAAGRR